MDSLVVDQAVVADLGPQRVEKDDGMNRTGRPVLPLPDFPGNGIGHRLIRSGETSTP